MNGNVELDGVLPVLKPAGFTSHDIVAKVRRLLRTKRIGHTGTLDPDVTGVLPLCVGRATKAVEWLQEMPKEYEAEMAIGWATDTEDASGTIIDKADHVSLSEGQITAVLNRLVGDIEQIPPMYSAVKVAGRKLYELAREGKEVERQARRVTIYELKPLSIDIHKEYPTVRFTVRCSKGTYVRTLCTDIGKELGYPAVMVSLVRTESGNIRIDDCLSLDRIEQLAQTGEIGSSLIPADQALSHFPAAEISTEHVKKALNGMKLPISYISPNRQDGANLIRLYTPEHTFIGIYRIDYNTELVVPVKVFV